VLILDLEEQTSMLLDRVQWFWSLDTFQPVDMLPSYVEEDVMAPALSWRLCSLESSMLLDFVEMLEPRQ
jgi:hypothetical protein